MKEDLSRREREALTYRKKRLRDKAEQVELLISGHGESVRPLTRNEAGEYAEEKTRALCRELAGPLDLGEAAREELESFLYCALRLEGDELAFCLPGHRGRWNDLVELAHATNYWDKSELYYDELLDPNTAHGLFSCLDGLLYDLLGWDAAASISPEERAALPEDLRLRLEKELRGREEVLAESEVSDEEYSEIERERYDTLSPEEQQWEDEEQARFREEEERKRKWLAGFPHRDALLQEYLRFRRLFAEGPLRGDRLGAYVEEAVDLYLCRTGKSYFLEDDRYFYAYGLLDRAVKALREPPRGED